MQAIEIHDLPGAKWAGRLVLLAALSKDPVGRDPIAQLSWGGGRGQTGTLWSYCDGEGGNKSS